MCGLQKKIKIKAIYTRWDAYIDRRTAGFLRDTAVQQYSAGWLRTKANQEHHLYILPECVCVCVCASFVIIKRSSGWCWCAAWISARCLPANNLDDIYIITSPSSVLCEKPYSKLMYTVLVRARDYLTPKHFI